MTTRIPEQRLGELEASAYQSDTSGHGIRRISIDTNELRTLIATARRERVLAEQVKAKDAEIARLREALEEALEPGVFGPWSTVEDPLLKDSGLLELCKRTGFGAVMHYVEYLWSKHTEHPGSEHTCAACASVRRDWIKRARTALTTTPATTRTDDAGHPAEGRM